MKKYLSRRTTGYLMKSTLRYPVLFLLAFGVLLIASCTAIEIGPLPSKIADLEVAIEVKHSKTEACYSRNDQYPERGLRYKWKYKTAVSSQIDSLEIIEFGGFVWVSDRWEMQTIYSRPFNNAEFAEWYDCPNGVLEAGVVYSDRNNWTTTDVRPPRDGKNLWYFIGQSPDGQRFVGYEVITTLAEFCGD